MPWIIDEVEDKIQTALGMNHLIALEINDLYCKSWVANEFLDVLTCFDLPENGLDKLIMNSFDPQCEPFEEEVISRLANMCTRLSYLELCSMDDLTEAGRMSIFNLFRRIIQQNPPIEVLNLWSFSSYKDKNQNIGELILETLLSSSIDSVTDLNLSDNKSWFQHS